MILINTTIKGSFSVIIDWFGLTKSYVHWVVLSMNPPELTQDFGGPGRRALRWEAASSKLGLLYTRPKWCTLGSQSWAGRWAN